MEYEISCVQAKIQESIEKIEKWQKEGKNLVNKMRPLNKKSSFRKSVADSAAIASIRPHVEKKVSAKAGELLAEGDDAWERAANEYSPMMAAIAKSLSPGFTTAAVERRRQIASVMPNMRPNTDADKKRGRKKGGDNAADST